jgi:hypothetical protein
MAAQEDSLLSPITAAADCSESTTLLVAKVQSTVHNMCMKNMVELCRSPASARFCPLIGFIWKIQHILQVLTSGYPLSQLGGQPTMTQDRMFSPVYLLQPL